MYRMAALHTHSNVQWPTEYKVAQNTLVLGFISALQVERERHQMCLKERVYRLAQIHVN